MIVGFCELIFISANGSHCPPIDQSVVRHLCDRKGENYLQECVVTAQGGMASN